MKKIFIISISLLFTQISFSQEKVEWVDVDEIWEQAGIYESEQEYEKALEEIKKIPKNDSTYYSSLTSQAYYLINSDQNEEAVKVANEGLKSKYQSFHYYFTINKIAGMLGLEDYQGSIDAIDEALKVYPKNHKLYYNKGIAYEGLKKYEKAAEMYKIAITFNPFYANSHLKLAVLCYNEQLITQTMMCLNLYLLINPDGAGSFKMLNAYNNMVKSKNESVKHPGVKMSVDDDSFEEIDMIINNYAALNKKYKISNKIVLPVIKQNHAMMDQLKDYEGNGGFWDKYYVPLHQYIKKEDLFNAFSYTIAYSVENEKYKALINKNISSIKSFLSTYQTEWFEIISKNEAIIDGKKTVVKYLYSNSKIEGFGAYKDGNTVGEWQVFDKNGRLTSTGVFDDEGKKNGKWTWYDDDGKITEEEEQDHGTLINDYRAYHSNGKTNVEANYKEGKLDGVYKKYNKYGALVEFVTYTEGEYEGDYFSYYPIGKDFIEYKIPYTKGEVNGKVYQYFPDGKVKSEMDFKDNKREGATIIYYHNGQIDTKKMFTANELSGEYLEYHSNGNLYKKGQCEDGDFVGIWYTYYGDNTPETEFTYSKGVVDGLYKKYDRDGVLHYEYTYKKGDLIAYKFFNKQQEIIKEDKKKGGEFFYEGHAANGNITTEGMYDVSGGKEGVWKFYTDNHVLESKEILTESKLQEELTAYYENGDIKKITPYQNDTAQGYYVSYFTNKQMNQQGWYNKGELEGEWLTYYPNGTLQQNNYYSNGKLYGMSKNYAVDGTLASSDFYYDDKLKTEYIYNSKGEVFNEVNHVIDSTHYLIEYKYVNNEINNSYTVLYGKKHGPYFSNYFSGKPQARGQYLNNEQSGEWKWYYENGKVSNEGSFINGNKNGPWKTYHKNGKVKQENHYDYGAAIKTEKSYNDKGILTQTRQFNYNKIHGEINFYSEDGKHQITRYYNYGVIVGYGYKDKSGKSIPMIPIKNETAKLKGFFDNGKPSRIMEIRNGSFINDYIEYYYNGQIHEEKKYENDDIEGPLKTYYADGTLKEEKSYITGQVNGELKIYHPNGKLKRQTTYINNERHGSSKSYDATGKLIKEQTYFDDDVVSEKIYK